MTTKQQNKLNEAAKRWAWEVFCGAHPHEAYAHQPERFWEYFHAKRPHITRKQMVQLLKDTEAAYKEYAEPISHEADADMGRMEHDYRGDN